MKSYYLNKTGSAKGAFELKETPLSAPKPTEISIAVKTFGINFADVLARKGMYADAPPLPSIIGYEIAGEVIAVGQDVKHLQIGQRVAAFTRFGGYTSHLNVQAETAIEIPSNISYAEANALTTQYCTAYYAFYYAANVQKGESVLIHSAAGGVGLALVQMAALQQCSIYATVGSENKKSIVQQQGVEHIINYSTQDFSAYVHQNSPNKKVDVIFDAVGGKVFKQGKKIIAAGGRIALYGASSRTEKGNNKLSLLKFAFEFGFLHPVWFVMKSVSVLGINMLRIADNKPHILAACMQGVFELAAKGYLKPVIGHVYDHQELAQAHSDLENRNSVGKLVVCWET